MVFKTKLRKIGNSLGVYIPKKVITSYKEGDVITLNVITFDKPEKITTQVSQSPKLNIPKNPNRKPYAWCQKHSVSKHTCKCN